MTCKCNWFHKCSLLYCQCTNSVKSFMLDSFKILLLPFGETFKLVLCAYTYKTQCNNIVIPHDFKYSAYIVVIIVTQSIQYGLLFHRNICAKLPMCSDFPCDSSDYSVADIDFSLFMVHSGSAILISIVILQIPMTASDMQQRWVGWKKS